MSFRTEEKCFYICFCNNLIRTNGISKIIPLTDDIGKQRLKVVEADKKLAVCTIGAAIILESMIIDPGPV